MINREKLLDWIERFNQGNLEGRELKEFLSLMDKHPRLRAEVKLDKEINDFLAEKDILEIRKVILSVRNEEKNNNSCNPSIYFLAASIFLLIGILFYFFFHDGSACLENKKDVILDQKRLGTKEIPVPGPGIEQKTTIITGKGREPVRKTNRPQDRTLLAERFLPDPAYESLVGMTPRNGLFLLSSPENSRIYEPCKRIQFQWTGIQGREVSLDILDNSGRSRLIVDHITYDTLRLSTTSLGTGLFYFKIITKDEILYFGKFIIK